MPTLSQYLTPTDDEKTILYCILGYSIGILFLWNLPYVKVILYPFKLVTVALHEFGHASAGVCTGAKIIGIEVNPDEGGVTRMRGGSPCYTLPAGYLGSSFFGALMVFSAFNILASKIVSVIICVCLLLTLYWAKNWLTRGLTFLFMGVIIGLWFIDGGNYLRYVVLFMGVMSCLYSLWDIIEDLVLRKVNESDATQFAKHTGCCVPQFWGFLWFIISLIFLGISIILGLIAFKDTSKMGN